MQSYAGILNFLSQIFGLLIFILASISTLLIYSLLMNSTESKVFDSGVMRMLGLNKQGFVCMVFTQAVAFVIPSIVIGYVCACHVDLPDREECVQHGIRKLQFLSLCYSNTFGVYHRRHHSPNEFTNPNTTSLVRDFIGVPQHGKIDAVRDCDSNRDEGS